MLELSACTDALKFLQLEGVKDVYKCACRYQKDDEDVQSSPKTLERRYEIAGNIKPQEIDTQSEDTSDSSNEVTAAFVVFRDKDDKRVRYSMYRYVTEEKLNEFQSCKADAMKLASLPLPQGLSEQKRETYNEYIASALAYASYCNFETAKKFIDEALSYYDTVTKDNAESNILSNSSIFAFMSVVLLIGSKIHPSWMSIDTASPLYDWFLGIDMSILGVYASICWKRKIKFVNDIATADDTKYLLEVLYRVLLGMASAIVLIAAFKNGWFFNGSQTKFTYMLIGFIAGFSEMKVIALVNSISSKLGIKDADKDAEKTSQEAEDRVQE
ncbi:MAG: hypothetical protein IJ183_01130 [Prevotella sp.]|nr:hypothetical protein [Prevotella sp.]